MLIHQLIASSVPFISSLGASQLCVRERETEDQRASELTESHIQVTVHGKNNVDNLQESLGSGTKFGTPQLCWAIRHHDVLSSVIRK